jgi:drug/metabolite transporter (DMT)-like permease
MADSDPQPASTPLAELRSSARGWHRVQLATIGFIGLCGVLQGGRPDNPMWLQVLAALLALAALALACVGTFLVARVAWPLYGGRDRVGADEGPELAREGARLRTGLVLTFAAVAVLGLATATGWWPQPGGSTGGRELVSVQATNGERVCGELGDAGPGRLSVTVNGSPVVVSLADVAVLSPVNRC